MTEMARPSGDRSRPDPDLLLHDVFFASASRWPDRIAVEVPPGLGRPGRLSMTYAALARESERLAQVLRDVVQRECVVGILLPRDSAGLYAAQLAVMHAGAAYTCVDPAFPDERIREIFDDAEVVAVFTDAGGLARVRAGRLTAAAGFDVLIGDEPSHETVVDPLPGSPVHARAATGIRPPWLTSGSLAYVIYTSGTTGRPKGVMIEHRSIVNLVLGDVDAFRLGPDDRVAQNSSASYDSSLEEIWLAFAAGATLVVMDEESVRLGPDLVAWLRSERVTVFCPPPTLLRATGCEAPDVELPELKFVYLGGEALPQDLSDRWARGRLLVNGYGPTECAVTCIREPLVEGQAVTIGWPIAGLAAWVVDASLEEVPDGQPGELVVGGVGLARGYWRRPEVTAEKFIEHTRLGRVYRTGDLVQRDPDGRFLYHGRIDAQVKIRGYRIELGEIENRLASIPGVRAAACNVQDDSGESTLVAFVVPTDASRPPLPEDLRRALAAVLPEPMVPARYGCLAELPTTVGGKLHRKALPRIEAGSGDASRTDFVAPRSALETVMASAVVAVLDRRDGVSIHDDFFRQLGGDSLRAARLVTRLRGNAETAWVTVRDVYEARTVAGLAGRAPVVAAGEAVTPDITGAEVPRPRGHPVLVSVAQGLWLLLAMTAGSAAGGWLVFEALPRIEGALGFVAFIAVAPLLVILLRALSGPLALGFAVVLKRILIGTYRPMRAPVWSGFYLRNWIVQQAVRLVPWRTLEGTVFQHHALRALGARIGRGVHIHRGVDLLRGGWDLLDIGDDVTIGQDAAVRLVELDGGEIVVGPVTLRQGATLETRSGVSSHTVMGAGTCLAALSMLSAGACVPDGERWDGIPARHEGAASPPGTLPPGARVMDTVRHGLCLVSARIGLGLMLALPAEILAIVTCLTLGLGPGELWSWFSEPGSDWKPWFAALFVTVTSVPATLVWAALILRFMGTVREGVISRWSPAYIRVWLKTGMVDQANEWLSGTLFWPVWLRWAGMRIGKGCEVSTLLDSVPELIEMGDMTFLADGIYLGGPRIQAGVVTLGRTVLGPDSFLGNHAVVAGGQRLPGDILLGVCTVGDDRRVTSGSSWFGHPPFELPRREVVEMDRSLTHDPSPVRYWNRVFWELLRFALPLVPLLVLVFATRVLMSAAGGASTAVFIAFAVPASTLGAATFLAGILVALKWMLLGRVRPGQHPLWSCWCSRWDFLYVAWSQHGRPVLEPLEGTLWLNFFLRAMGMKIGRRVVLGPGFSQVVDPDMITLEDDATVNAIFQAHTFEDRVLKIDHVHVRRGATLGDATVPLYGADIGEGTWVGAHSVIMKAERLLPGLDYAGAPCRAGAPHRRDLIPNESRVPVP